ncbi:ABC transporter permease [Actinospica robiniae]|uniref:ABC transporter permease n=1 Tax=Actinospica robiniae TaxID=304901 RepID=UPI00041FD211|nr:ABC transporter permease subunit [Actinospica robiniae]
MMTLSRTRIRAIAVKEMRDYRRNRFVVSTMGVLPLVFIVLPIIDIFKLGADVPASKLDDLIGVALLYLLLIPALVPATVAAHSVVGEREQGTLEPVLTSPVRKEEFLLGKALAVFVPTIAIAYTMFGIFLAAVGLFAHQNVVTDVFQVSRILPQALFTPLLAGWSIWAAIAISTKVGDVRVAQQLGSLVSLPPLAIASLMGFGVIQPTVGLALALGAVLLVIDVGAWRLVSRLFDRERLVTGTKA